MTNNNFLPKSVTQQSLENPFEEVNIYNVTTKCYRHKHGNWTYIGKIYFRKGQTTGILHISGCNMGDLINKMSQRMSNLNKEGC